MRKSPFFPKLVLWQHSTGHKEPVLWVTLSEGHVHPCPAEKGGWCIQQEKSLSEAQCKEQEDISSCNTKGTWGSSPTFTQAQAGRCPWHTGGRQEGHLQCPGAVCTPRDPASQRAEQLAKSSCLGCPQPPRNSLRPWQGQKKLCLNSKG